MAELICPRCGLKYYGVGCPNCDWPAAAPDPGLAKRNRIVGWIALAWGLFLASLFYSHFAYHNFLVLVAGSMLGLAGFQIAAAGRFYKQDSRPSSFVVALIFACFAYLCFYAAFSKGRVSGGLPFILPDKWNQNLGKFVFGAIGCLWGWVSLWGFYRTVKPKPPFKPASLPSVPNH